jgi:hypothetical protein
MYVIHYTWYQLEIITATGLENWAMGSTFADVYSSPLNSEVEGKK